MRTRNVDLALNLSQPNLASNDQREKYMATSVAEYFKIKQEYEAFKGTGLENKKIFETDINFGPDKAETLIIRELDDFKQITDRLDSEYFLSQA